MPMLSIQFYLVTIIIASAAMLFGLRLFGSARGIAKFRDLTISGALGYGFLLVSLYQGIAFYNAPTAVFFRWAVQGVAFLALAGFTFQQLGRHVGTRATRKLFRSMPVSAALGILLIIAYATVAIFADVIAPYGQSEIFANSNVLPGGNPEMGGNPAHLLGTDQIGRDILSRLIFGAQNTVGIAFVTTLLAFFIGISLGFLAATIGGVLDQVLSRIVDMLMSIPQLIFALLLMTIATTWFGSQKAVITLMMVLIIAVLDSTRVFRLSRAVGMNIVVMDFFEAAKLRGEKMSYLIFREIAPNAFAPLLAEFGLRFCFVFLTIASLSFLGVGIQPPLADWGTMVRDLSNFINFAMLSPLTAALPLMAAGAIALLTVAVNFVVDWMLHRASGLKE
jgi:peptide/nickel transport system permease protein|tara:strand:+ start:1158 stop:2333 length:1176 start_codon:yes stop_codon:yes gene_type:complete